MESKSVLRLDTRLGTCFALISNPGNYGAP